MPARNAASTQASSMAAASNAFDSGALYVLALNSQGEGEPMDVDEPEPEPDLMDVDVDVDLDVDVDVDLDVDVDVDVNKPESEPDMMDIDTGVPAVVEAEHSHKNENTPTTVSDGAAAASPGHQARSAQAARHRLVKRVTKIVETTETFDTSF